MARTVETAGALAARVAAEVAWIDREIDWREQRIGELLKTTAAKV